MADIDRRRGKWVARWREPGTGRQRSKAFTRYQDAQSHLAKIRTEIDQGTYIPAERGAVTLRAYAETYLLARTHEATTRVAVEMRWRKHILPVLGDVPLASLARQPSLITAWVAGLDRAGMAPSYIRVCLSTLSALLNAAVDDSMISRNPCSVRSVSAPRAPRSRVVPWEAARVAAVRAALDERFRAMVDCGSGLGLRQGEIFALSPDDIDFLRPKRDGGPVVHVRRQVRLVAGKMVFAPPKGRKEGDEPRTVPLPESVQLRLAAHAASFPALPVTLSWREPGGRGETVRLMFTTVTGKAHNRNTFNNYEWKPALNAAGVPRTRENGMHALRHHFASALLADGVDIRALAEFLGHEDPAFTLRTYTHLLQSTPDRMRAAIDRALAEQADAALQDHVRADVRS